MQGFAYHRPASLDEAVGLSGRASDPRYLAGGMTLIPTLKQRLASPSDLIDLSRIAGLDRIAVDGGRVVIGALARHAAVAASEEVRRAIPALARLAGLIGDRQVRNRGTLGGSLANSDPAADYPAAVIALSAEIATDRRRIAADDYFLDLFETALQPGEAIREAAFPVPARAAYRKFRHPASRYAVVGVFVAELGGALRVGVTGAGPCAFRWRALEDALGGGLDPGAAERAALDSGRFNADMHASAEYRAALTRVMARRALEDLAAAPRVAG